MTNEIIATDSVWTAGLAIVLGIACAAGACAGETALNVKLHPADTPLTPAPEKLDAKDVLAFDSFENKEPAIIVYTKTEHTEPTYDQNFDPKYLINGNASLRVTCKKGEHNANQVLDFRPEKDEDHLFMRTYLYFPENFKVAPACEIKLLGYTGDFAGQKAKERKSWTTDYFTTRLAISRDDMLQLLTYHPLQKGEYADHIDTGVKIEWGKWYCFELELKANTVLKATPELLAKNPDYRQRVRGEYVVLDDGVARCWVDGRMRAELLNVRFRDVPDLLLRRVGTFPYFGGAGERNTCPQNQIFYVDEFVVARTYIGPVKKD